MHTGIQFLILQLEYAFYDALLHTANISYANAKTEALLRKYLNIDLTSLDLLETGS